MKIINGPKWLNLASSTRSIKLAPLTVSDNMIADRQLLATLMTTYKPGEFLIFMDSSLELNTFTSLDLGTKTGLKDQFLCTDIEDGIARMITPYEEAAAKEVEEAKKAQEEQLKMASYKQKYEEVQTELSKVKSNAKIALEEVENRNNQITRLHDELDSANSTITELRTALQSAADKIESMKNEFNGVCKKFGLTRQCTEGSNPEWSQDLSVVEEYNNKVESYNGLAKDFKELYESKEKLKEEFENYKKSWTLVHDDLMEVQKQFGIYKDDGGKWQMIQDEKYQGNTTTELNNPAEDTEKVETTESQSNSVG